MIQLKPFLSIATLLLVSSSYADSQVSTANVSTQTKTETTQLEADSVAPDFSLKGSDGKLYSLKDFQGKVVVLEWFNDDCPFVKKHYETGNMQKLQEKYTQNGIVWLSISSSKPGKALSEKEAEQIRADRKAKSTALLIDADGTVARSYGAKTTPHMFVINGEGKIVYNGAIDDDSSFKKESVKKAHNYVTEALDFATGKSKKPLKSAVTRPYGCSVKI